MPSVSLKGKNVVVDVMVDPEIAKHRSMSEEAGSTVVFTLRCLVDMTEKAGENHDGWFSAVAVNDKFLVTWPWLNKHDLTPAHELSNKAPVDFVVNNLLSAHKNTGSSLLNQGNIEVRKNEYGFIEVKATSKGITFIHNQYKNSEPLEDRAANISLLIDYANMEITSKSRKKVKVM